MYFYEKGRRKGRERKGRRRFTSTGADVMHELQEGKMR